ncbi:hypothetical protein N656DRAFT_783209 [Canariomyces notabilis]|uniref:Uncharacterized protein n=1 Tax=Canariomyces notabilis TaxID=2074819 RepID=A0AAN6T9Z2_9PEZI|nr:hypothetical protein N656DRAFT_783209 [Canariomyces arenarius]
MEDEEYYHLMLSDLERVHHHLQFPEPQSRGRNSVPVVVRERQHNPSISGIRVVLNEAFRYGYERLGGTRNEGKGKSC